MMYEYVRAPLYIRNRASPWNNSMMAYARSALAKPPMPPRSPRRYHLLGYYIRTIQRSPRRPQERPPGPSQVTANMIKAWPAATRMLVYQHMSNIWTSRTIPPWFKDKLMKLIPKSPDSEALDDMRPISLYEIIRKIYSTAPNMDTNWTMVSKWPSSQSLMKSKEPMSNKTKAERGIGQGESASSLMWIALYDMLLEWIDPANRFLHIGEQETYSNEDINKATMRWQPMQTTSVP